MQKPVHRIAVTWDGNAEQKWKSIFNLGPDSPFKPVLSNIPEKKIFNAVTAWNLNEVFLFEVNPILFNLRFFFFPDQISLSVLQRTVLIDCVGLKAVFEGQTIKISSQQIILTNCS